MKFFQQSRSLGSPRAFATRQSPVQNSCNINKSESAQVHRANEAKVLWKWLRFDGKYKVSKFVFADNRKKSCLLHKTRYSIRSSKLVRTIFADQPPVDITSFQYPNVSPAGPRRSTMVESRQRCFGCCAQHGHLSGQLELVFCRGGSTPVPVDNQLGWIACSCF